MAVSSIRAERIPPSLGGGGGSTPPPEGLWLWSAQQRPGRYAGRFHLARGSMLTDIFLCHPCSYHEIEGRNGRAGDRATIGPDRCVDAWHRHTAGEWVAVQADAAHGRPMSGLFVTVRAQVRGIQLSNTSPEVFGEFPS
jgi:hypothetical protein